MNIEGVSIADGAPCRFVAELSNAHNGSFERLLKLITAAKDSGASLVKLQCYSPDELVALRGDGPAPEPWGSDGWTMATLYEKARTPFEWFHDLFRYARDIGIVPFASVFGLESLDVLKAVKCPLYKISKLDNKHSWLIGAALRESRPVLVSVEKRAEHNVIPGVYNLFCPGAYDSCGPEDIHLPRDFEQCGYLGLSSHCVEPELAIAAVVRGAKLLEYHFQLDNEPSELEESVSLYASDFAEMVRSVKTVEAMLA